MHPFAEAGATLTLRESMTAHHHPQPLAAVATPPFAPSMGATPGLGGTTDVYYEWWNVDLVRKLYRQLGKEERAAVARVREEAVPWKHPRTGEMRKRPTAAEKLVQKKRERRERLRLMSERFNKYEEDAACIVLERNGKPTTDGPRKFWFKGKMRFVKLDYARMKKSGIGRRYPKNAPAIWKVGDEFMGEQDRLLAATAQGMPRDVRKFCLPFLHDIDLKACHPAILASKARQYGVKVPQLDWYVKHTDDLRQMVMELHGVGKDQAKTLFTLLLYGGSYTHRIEKWGRKGNEAEPIAAVKKLERELRALRDAVMARAELAHLVQPIFAAEKQRKSNFADRCKTDEEANRSTWSQITQAWEDEALGCIQKAVEASGLVVHSLMFDGLMVYHDPRIDLQAAMDAAANRIRTETGMVLALEEKELFDQERTDALV